MFSLLRLLLVVATLGLTVPAASAAPVSETVVSQLQEQGFTRIRVSRTLLGRTRIVAMSPQFRREIVLNSTTGEILRDYWKQIGTAPESGNAPALVDPRSPPPGHDDGGSGGPGGDDNHDDDGDEDSDDDDNDDDSGDDDDDDSGGGDDGGGDDDDDD